MFPFHPPQFFPLGPARRPRGTHVNDSNKYLIKARGDAAAAARGSPLLSVGRVGEVGGRWDSRAPARLFQKAGKFTLG